MTSITEDYVSFETAKLLKEKGFDESTSMVYMPYGDLCKLDRYDSIRNSNYNDITKNYFEYTAPTLQMAMKWLREVHKMHIIAEPCLGEENEPNLSFNRWFWTILKEDGEYKPIRQIDEFSTYEQASEAAIKYCIEHLI